MNIRLSSYKRGHGIRELLLRDKSEFWASDNSLPHGILINFDTLTYVEEIRIFLDFKKDDSYTPSEIEVRAGLLEEYCETIHTLFCDEPQGYQSIMVKKDCLCIQIIVLANHQEGKDCHIRHLVLMEKQSKEIYMKIKDHY